VTTEQREPVRRGLTTRGHNFGSGDNVTGEKMVVGMAYSGDRHPHQNLAGARRIKFDLADFPILADPADDCGATFHDVESSGA
jgi:hypothetical protein